MHLVGGQVTRVSLLGVLLLAVVRAFAAANFVYHEQTANFVATPTCFPTSGGTDTACGRYVENTNRGTLFDVKVQAGETYTLRFKSEFQFFVNEARVYYTTNGTTPAGSFGVPFGATMVSTAAFTCTYSDQTQGCQIVDVCTATIPPQPAGTTVKYIVSAWHSGGGPEVFGNSGTCSSCFSCTNSVSGCATVFEYTVVPPPATGTTITAAPNPSFAGESVTFTATVTNLAGVVTNGSVTFKAGAATLGTVPLTGSGEARLTNNSLALGSRTVRAEYSGHSTSFLASTGSITHTVLGVNARVWNTNGISIADLTTATPYPSRLIVSHLLPAIDTVTVVLSNVSHTFPNDLDILLKSPSGLAVMLMSDVGGGGPGISNGVVRFTARATTHIGTSLVSGTYLPSNVDEPDPFPGPAPSAYGTNLAALEQTNPNGLWDLYVLDDAAGDIGTIGSWGLEIRAGYRLRIETSGTNVVLRWPASADGFQLESSPGLPASWAPVSTTAVIIDEENVVTLPATGTERYFRLRR